MEELSELLGEKVADDSAACTIALTIITLSCGIASGTSRMPVSHTKYHLRHLTQHDPPHLLAAHLKPSIFTRLLQVIQQNTNPILREHIFRSLANFAYNNSARTCRR